MSKRSIPYGQSCCVPRQFIDMSDVKIQPSGNVSIHHGSLTEIVARSGRKTDWCANCRAGDHGKCNGRRIKKYERGYAPCACAAHGHGRTTS